MTRLTRRKLLLGTCVAAVLPTGWLAIHAGSSRVSIIKGYLRRQLPDLAITDINLEQFALDYVERYVDGAGRKVYHHAIFLLLDNPTLVSVTPEVVRVAFDKFSRQLLTRFLQSTDFFGDAGQRADKTTYAGMYDPYENACANPLADLAAEA